MNRPQRKLDVLYPRHYQAGGEERTHWMQVGVAFESEKGTDVVLYVIPPHNELGETRFMLREPDPERVAERERRSNERKGGAQQAPRTQYRDPRPAYNREQPPRDDDDKIPF